MPGFNIPGTNVNLAFQNAGSPDSFFNQWGIGGGRRFEPKGYDIDPAAFQDPNAAANKQRYLDAIAAAGGRTYTEDPSIRGQQQGYLDMLKAGAEGTGPSVVDMQLKAATDRNLSSAAALAGSARGVNPALAQRQLQMNQANINQQAAGQGAVARLQETMAMRDAYGQALSGVRGQDFQSSALGMQQQQMNDEMIRYYEGLGFSTDQASFMAQQALEQLRVQEALGTDASRTSLSESRNSLGGELLGAATSAGGAIGAALAMSDERSKKDVKDGTAAAQAFMDALEAKGYLYKNPSAPGAAPGPQVGVMAQDLEASPMGSQMVVNTPAGKMVEPASGFPAVLASLSNLNERLKAFEGDMMSKKGIVGAVARGSAPFGTPREWLSGEAFAPGGRFGPTEDLGTAVNRHLDAAGSGKTRMNTQADLDAVATFDQPAAKEAYLKQMRMERTPAAARTMPMATETLPPELAQPYPVTDLEKLDRERRMKGLLKLYGQAQGAAAP